MEFPLVRLLLLLSTVLRLPRALLVLLASVLIAQACLMLV